MLIMSDKESSPYRTVAERIAYLHDLGGLSVLGLMQSKIRGGDTRHTGTTYDVRYDDSGYSVANLSWDKIIEGKKVRVGVEVGASTNRGMGDSSIKCFVGDREIHINTTEGPNWPMSSGFIQDMEAQGIDIPESVAGDVLYAIWWVSNRAV